MEHEDQKRMYNYLPAIHSRNRIEILQGEGKNEIHGGEKMESGFRKVRLGGKLNLNEGFLPVSAAKEE